MALGPLITDDVRRLIAQVYEDNPDWVAKQVRNEVDRLLHEDNPKLKPGWPGLSAVQKEIGKNNEIRKNLPPGETALDGMWSLGASVKYGVPEQANADLIKIWRWCLVVGRKFTIREAKWAARLRCIVPTQWVLEHAVDYAQREKVSKLLGIDLDTTDLDGKLAFPRDHSGSKHAWLRNTAKALGVLPRREPILAEKQYQEKRREEWLNRSEAGERGGMLTDHMNFRPSYIVALNLGLPFKFMLPVDLPEDVDMVYAMWLRRFGESAKWSHLSDTEREEVASRLFDEVTAAATKRDILPSDYSDLEVSLKGFHWTPSNGLLSRISTNTGLGHFEVGVSALAGDPIQSGNRSEPEAEASHQEPNKGGAQ